MTTDRFLVCSACGTRFLWTAGEQAVSGQPPQLCPPCRLLLPSEGRRRGVVKFFNVRKNWGFITAAQGGEIFFHGSQVGGGEVPSTPPQEGELVEYSVEATARGPQAVNVRRL